MPHRCGAGLAPGTCLGLPPPRLVCHGHPGGLALPRTRGQMYATNNTLKATEAARHRRAPRRDRPLFAEYRRPVKGDPQRAGETPRLAVLRMRFAGRGEPETISADRWRLVKASTVRPDFGTRRHLPVPPIVGELRRHFRDRTGRAGASGIRTPTSRVKCVVRRSITPGPLTDDPDSPSGPHLIDETPSPSSRALVTRGLVRAPATPPPLRRPDYAATLCRGPGRPDRSRALVPELLPPSPRRERRVKLRSSTTCAIADRHRVASGRPLSRAAHPTPALAQTVSALTARRLSNADSGGSFRVSTRRGQSGCFDVGGWARRAPRVASSRGVWAKGSRRRSGGVLPVLVISLVEQPACCSSCHSNSGRPGPSCRCGVVPSQEMMSMPTGRQSSRRR